MIPQPQTKSLSNTLHPHELQQMVLSGAFWCAENHAFSHHINKYVIHAVVAMYETGILK